MSPLLIRICAIALISLTTLGAQAASVDVDLRLAAQLHRTGETRQAIAIWERWANQGDTDAAYNLALIHHHADGVALDLVTAMRWYRVAAERGDKVSQIQIGLMYQLGQGVEADAEEAHRWFTMHRKHHFHHANSPQMLAWRQQALALIEQSELQEQRLLAQKNSAQIIAELRQRAQPQPAFHTEHLAASSH